MTYKEWTANALPEWEELKFSSKWGQVQNSQIKSENPYTARVSRPFQQNQEIITSKVSITLFIKVEILIKMEIDWMKFSSESCQQIKRIIESEWLSGWSARLS